MVKIKDLKDSELIDLYIDKNNKDAFGEIYDRYVSDVYRFIYSKIGCKEQSESITSDTFFWLMDNIGKYNHKSQLKTFIVGVAFNKIKQFWSKNKESYEVNVDDDFIEDSNSGDSEIENISSENIETSYEKHKNIASSIKLVLSKLAKKYREILVKRFLEEKNTKVISRELKISPENVRIRQFRAIRSARNLINKKVKLSSKQQW
ncbi:sigma-70 family RNA polymerase sigma factor [Candidatus Dojkabacteria bacterium]|nr:sigma-70 family RNA polymerase sigma factor [Candidatus Dojkabacteria bacterium]